MTRLIAWLMVLGSLAYAATDPVVAVRYRVVSVDRVEREFHGAGQRRPVIGVFSTVYKVKGKAIPAMEFWDRLSPGDEVDAKVRLHELFSIAVAGNLSIDTHPRSVTP